MVRSIKVQSSKPFTAEKKRVRHPRLNMLRYFQRHPVPSFHFILQDPLAKTISSRKSRTRKRALNATVPLRRQANHSSQSDQHPWLPCQDTTKSSENTALRFPFPDHCVSLHLTRETKMECPVSQSKNFSYHLLEQEKALSQSRRSSPTGDSPLSKTKHPDQFRRRRECDWKETKAASHAIAIHPSSLHIKGTLGTCSRIVHACQATESQPAPSAHAQVGSACRHLQHRNMCQRSRFLLDTRPVPISQCGAT